MGGIKFLVLGWCFRLVHISNLLPGGSLEKDWARAEREHYEFAGDLPHRLLALIKELDGKSAIQFTKARPTDRMPDPNQPSGRTT
jgi:hypothetical protein